MNLKLFIYLIYIPFLWFEIACIKDLIVHISWIMDYVKILRDINPELSELEKNLHIIFSSTFPLYPRKLRYREVPPQGMVSK